MKTVSILVASGLLVAVLAGTFLGQTPQTTNVPRYTANGELIMPENYREWVWLSSGMGMAYGPEARESANPLFDNVFVTPEAYRSFLQTGTWPDKTMLVLELRASQTEGSINKAGRFQGAVRAVEVEVKDESRFPGKWAFFNFRNARTPVKELPQTADCYSCHAENGAVDNTFVQFYPTLIDIAREKGTLK
jgi:hypothetical protein